MSEKLLHREASEGPDQAKTCNSFKAAELNPGKNIIESWTPKDVYLPETESGPSPLYVPVLLLLSAILAQIDLSISPNMHFPTHAKIQVTIKTLICSTP